MTVSKFFYCDRLRSWTLEEMSFSPFTLLVGVSGVGKTRILRALIAVAHCGTRSTRSTNGANWRIDLISEEGNRYSWSVETSLVPGGRLSHFSPFDDHEDAGEVSSEIPKILIERLTLNNIETIVERDCDKFLFNGKPLPKLKDTESAITLLRDEQSVAPVFKMLSRFVFCERDDSDYGLIPFSYAEQAIEKYKSIDQLREATKVPTIVKAYALQMKFAELFNQVVSEYQEIFPSVTRVRLDQYDKLEQNIRNPYANWITIGIQESGVEDWITGSRLSSGMLRTLMHLLQLALAPDGTVIIIDEFENSLGINCLPQVTDRILERSPQLQFVLTSHHPYVINNIPPSRWKVVSRRGSLVSVQDAEALPALNSASAHDKFILLMNLREYEHGIES